MKLDRNINRDTRGKYALLKLRLLDRYETGDPFETISKPVADAITLLEEEGILDWGIVGSDSEFFVIRLKDHHAAAALSAYAESAARLGDKEYAGEIDDLAVRAAQHPNRKMPD